MRTCIDQNRGARNGDRRLHTADLEMSGRFVQLVPAIAQKLAPRAVTTNWGRETERLKGIEDEFMALGKRREQHRCQRERWWCEPWAQPKGLYQVIDGTTWSISVEIPRGKLREYRMIGPEIGPYSRHVQ